MDLTQTKIAFRKFAKTVQQRTRQRASRNHKATGQMAKDISFEVKVSPNSIQLVYSRPIYADFQDQGVSGTQKKYNTDFSYKSSSNVIGMEDKTGTFAKWAKTKGIKPRNKKTGKFMTFKAFGFAVAYNKKLFGIKPKGFFTDTFVKEYENLAIPIQRAYAKDAMDLLKTALK